ncbi:uncharacterized protein LDX57_010490 [Aspergillus melleus]|uniref:uncharacterized protein n=1 Tax=Aspergillus melleus TaxID=138277 RepID=UPI001E8CB3E2|nr:uncharacterized protein LDX57_010490 [Aspergillus melleus]KAH8432860.1 hypothetical protein LDX57_010490 [Aspergillus melleus]
MTLVNFITISRGLDAYHLDLAGQQCPAVHRETMNVDHSRIEADPPNPASALSEAKNGLPDENWNTSQDVEEVWFAGWHSDIGGGLNDGEYKALSHVPLVWIVQEAQRAGFQFDPENMKLFHCFDDPAGYSDLPDHLETSAGG